MVIKGLSDQCRGSLLKTRDLKGNYVKTVREKNLLERKNRDLVKEVARKEKKLERESRESRKEIRKKVEGHLKEIGEVVEGLKKEKNELAEKVAEMKEEMAKEVKRSVTEMGMRVSDILQSKKEVEARNLVLHNKVKNLLKDIQMMKTGFVNQNKRISVLEQEKKVLVNMIEQMKQGVDQEVNLTEDPFTQ